jgi:hypothetical protein
MYHLGGGRRKLVAFGVDRTAVLKLARPKNTDWI